MKKMRYIFMSFMLLSLFPRFAYCADVIRVGYAPNYGMIKSPTVHGFEGYGYEYLQKMLDYTSSDYEFDFFECTFDEGLYLMRIGLLDMYAPVIPTELLSEEYIFSEESFGLHMGLLVATNEDYIPTGSYTELTRKTIAVEKEDPLLSELLLFLEEVQISATIIELDAINYDEVWEQGGYDYIYTNSMRLETHLPVAFVVTSQESYLMARPHFDSLMHDLSSAIVDIKQDEFMYQERLYLKYFDRDYGVTQQITTTDYQLMRMKQTYLVGLSDTESPLSYLDETGELVGIYPDYLDLLAEKMGVQFEYVLLHDLTALTDLENLDFQIISLHDSDRLTWKQSNALFQLPFQFVQQENRSIDAQTQTVGTMDYYGLAQEDLDYYLTLDNNLTFSTLSKLAIAFQAGAVDSLFLTSSDYSRFLEEWTGNPLVSTALPYSFAPTLSFEEGFQQSKITIINKFIQTIPQQDVDFIIARHTNRNISTVSMETILGDYPIIINTALILVAASSMGFWVIERGKKSKFQSAFTRDSLTGLLTESYFLEEVSRIRATYPENEYSLVTLSIKDFHLFAPEDGPLLLKELATFVQNQSFDCVLACRAYNDNFLFFVKTEGVESELAKALHETSVFSPLCHSFLHTESPIYFRVGLVDIDVNEDDLDLNVMVSQGNYARDLCTKSRCSEFIKYTNVLDRQRSKEVQMLSLFQNALDSKEFELYFQPTVQLSDKKIWSGAETLVRWVRDGKAVVASEFIPVLESHGIVDQLDFYVLDELCAFLSVHPSETIPPLSVNLSQITLEKEGVLPDILSILAKYQVNPKDLKIELSESVFLAHDATIKSNLKQLNDAGFQLILDDFGRNKASLSLFQENTFQLIKIHPNFLPLSEKNSKEHVLISTMLELTKTLHLSVSATGIETSELRTAFQEAGLSQCQGFLYYRPMNKEQFLQELKSVTVKPALTSTDENNMTSATSQAELPAEEEKSVTASVTTEKSVVKNPSSTTQSEKNIESGEKNASSSTQSVKKKDSSGENTSSTTQSVENKESGKKNTSSSTQAVKNKESGGKNTSSTNQSVKNKESGGENTSSTTQSVENKESSGENTSSTTQSVETKESGGENTSSSTQSVETKESGGENTSSTTQSVETKESGGENTSSTTQSVETKESSGENPSSSNQSVKDNESTEEVVSAQKPVVSNNIQENDTISTDSINQELVLTGKNTTLITDGEVPSSQSVVNLDISTSTETKEHEYDDIEVVELDSLEEH